MWATKDDVKKRTGEEAYAKLGTRTKYNSALDSYVGDSSDVSVDLVIQCALDDTQGYLRGKLDCCFDTKYLNQMIADGEKFPSIFLHHIKLTVMALKFGGDCEQCTECKKSWDELCACGILCSDNGICVPLRPRFSVTPNVSCLPDTLCHTCAKESCCCE